MGGGKHFTTFCFLSTEVEVVAFLLDNKKIDEEIPAAARQSLLPDSFCSSTRYSLR
jgi:hypothetical protein